MCIFNFPTSPEDDIQSSAGLPHLIDTKFSWRMGTDVLGQTRRKREVFAFHEFLPEIGILVQKVADVGHCPLPETRYPRRIINSITIAFECFSGKGGEHVSGHTFLGCCKKIGRREIEVSVPVRDVWEYVHLLKGSALFEIVHFKEASGIPATSDLVDVYAFTMHELQIGRFVACKTRV